MGRARDDECRKFTRIWQFLGRTQIDLQPLYVDVTGNFTNQYVKTRDELMRGWNRVPGDENCDGRHAQSSVMNVDYATI
jgi:hypothetical protein